MRSVDERMYLTTRPVLTLKTPLILVRSFLPLGGTPKARLNFTVQFSIPRLHIPRNFYGKAGDIRALGNEILCVQKCEQLTVKLIEF